MPLQRLQKVMARAGVASRRACEDMIAAGRVAVNGRIVTDMGIKVDPQRDQVAVDGQLLPIREPPSHIYLMLYKPPGYLSVFNDDRGRPGLESLVASEERLFPVGRLDLDSEGLILLTNDGDAAQQLSHPRHHQSKSYLVLVDRLPGTAELARLRKGVQLSDGPTAPSRWTVLEKAPSVPKAAVENSPEGDQDGVWLRVTLYQGKKRQIRRMADAVNLKVWRLVRIGLGPLTLDRRLSPGDSRLLSRSELQRLRKVMQSPRTRRRGRGARGSSGGYRSPARKHPPRSGRRPSAKRRQ